MKRSKRLRVVAELAERKVRAAVSALQQSNRKLEQTRYSEDLLSSSHRSHIEHIEQRLTRGSSAYDLKVLSQSAQNLEKGLDQIANRIHQAESEHAARKQEWLAQRAKHQAIERVIERRADEEASYARRLAERAVDDTISTRRS